MGCSIQGPAFEAGTPEDVPQGWGLTPPHGLNIGYSGYLAHYVKQFPKKKVTLLDLRQLRISIRAVE
jgi:hypothetical protein